MLFGAIPAKLLPQGWYHHKSGQLLSDNLIPVLQKLPDQSNKLITEFTTLIHNNPQGLYSSLLNPETMAGMPSEFAQAIVSILNEMT